MPVIFKTPTSYRIFMLDSDAKFILEALQTSGNIPGTLFPEALPSALETLKNRVEIASDVGVDVSTQDEDGDDVSIHTKAAPLIELIQTAITQNEKLMWDKG